VGDGAENAETVCQINRYHMREKSDSAIFIIFDLLLSAIFFIAFFDAAFQFSFASTLLHTAFRHFLFLSLSSASLSAAALFSLFAASQRRHAMLIFSLSIDIFARFLLIRCRRHWFSMPIIFFAFIILPLDATPPLRFSFHSARNRCRLLLHYSF